MSKSKSKSKSKDLAFPSQYWSPKFDIYTYYPGLFEHGKELLAITVAEPPREGDEVAGELADLLGRQDHLNNNFNEREQRREEIEWEADHLSRRYQSTLLVSAESYPKTWQLMNTISDLALVPVMHFKKKFARARPTQLDPTIEPLIEVPGHPAYPSGHATQNFLIAHILSEVIGDDAELIARVFAIARGVAVNREWAGVHYASDTEGGENLARDIMPTMKRVFQTPIKEAIAEWQELEPETEHRRERQGQGVAMAGLYEPASKTWSGDDPYPGTHFRTHQWNLENVGQGGGKAGVDISVRGAWEQLGIWRESSLAGQSTKTGGTASAVRVAMVDLAIDFAHPALKDRLDYKAARNLDYPNVPKAAQQGDTGTAAERYQEAFSNLSSAHAIACAGIIAANAKQVPHNDKSASERDEVATEPGCLGIAPQCKIIPYRAMTLTETVLGKRRILARAVLEAVTGRRLVESRNLNGSEAWGTRGAAMWTVADSRDAPAQVLFFPLPLDPLPGSEGGQDPLALALAFAATKIPVVIPSGNRGTSSVSYLSVPNRHIQEPKSVSELSTLLGLDRDAVLAIFELAPNDEQLLGKLIYSISNEAAAICVGACNDRGHRSRYSQYGDGLTLVAPSDDILPARQVPDEETEGRAATARSRPQSIATTDLAGIGGYMQNQSHYTLSDNEFGFGGTSAAASQVTGVVALMLEANSKLGPTEVRQILCDTARITHETLGALLVSDSGAAPAKPSEEFGHGLVDATRAVQEALRKVEGAAHA